MQTNITQTNDLSETEENLQNPIDRLHIRLPQDLTVTPNSKFDIVHFDDMIVAGFIIQLMRMGNKNINVTTISRISKRSHKSIKRTLERLQESNHIDMKKVRNEYAEKQFGYRWRVWIPKYSPLNKMLHAKKGDGYKWTAVPITVAQFRSPLATALYMMLHLQKFVDGTITTTAADIGFALNCDSRTARRLLKFIGANEIYRKGYGNAVYDLELPYQNASPKSMAAATMKLRHIVSALEKHGIIDTRQTVNRILKEKGLTEYDPQKGLTQFNVKTAVAILELHYSHLLMQDEKYRPNILMRIGRGYYNKRMKNRGLKRVTKTDVKESLNNMIVQSDVRNALMRVCGDCNGDGIVPVPEQGHNVWGTCRSCKP